MYKCNEEFALKTALHLAEENIKSSNSWTSADSITYFIEQVYNFLLSNSADPEQK